MPNWLKSFGYKFKKTFSKIYNLKKIWPLRSDTFLGGKNGFDKQAELDQKLIRSLAKKRWPSFKQLKYVGQILSDSEKKRIKSLSILLLFLILAWGTNFYITQTEFAPKKGGTYIEGLVGFPKLINPLYSSLNQVDQDLVKLIYSGLVRVDSQQNIVADLAESWALSEDQKTYTFTLREGLKWQDGEPLTVDDVIFTFNAIQNSEFKSPQALNFEGVKIEKIDDLQIRFVLDEPYSPFLENLTLGILPEHVWQEVTPANALLADFNLKPIGSGPYKFKSLVKDKLGNIKSYTLVVNKNYYGQLPYIQEIVFKFYGDFNLAVDALQNRNDDGLNFLPKEFKDELKIRKDINYYPLQLPQYTALFFNQAKNEALKNLNVRQALAHALDKQDIIDEALKTEGQVVDAPILPGWIGYHPDVFKYDYNLDKAKELLDKAEYTLKEGADVRTKGDQELKVVLTTVNSKENELVAQMIQKMWQEVGVKVELNLVDPAIIKSDIIKNRSFEIILFSEIVGLDPDPYPFWHSSQAGENGFNLANFVNKPADKLLEDARKTSDPQTRQEKYVAFQNILSESLPAVFLYTPKYIYPVSDRIMGIDAQNIVSPADRFANINNWYIKTRRVIKHTD